MLTCIDCGATSEGARFYAGINRRCAECHKQRVRQNRKANIEYYRAFEAMRYARDYTKRRGLATAYAKTPEGKAAIKRSQEAWKARNQEKRAAHVLLGNALRDGRLIRPACCENCGSTGRIHGHHDDYSKPLDVRWLCAPCHAEVHHGARAVSAIRKRQETRA